MGLHGGFNKWNSHENNEKKIILTNKYLFREPHRPECIAIVLNAIRSTIILTNMSAASRTDQQTKQFLSEQPKMYFEINNKQLSTIYIRCFSTA